MPSSPRRARSTSSSSSRDWRTRLSWLLRGTFGLKHLREGETATDAVLREKRREEVVCELTGWRCIRIAWDDLYQPEVTAGRIRAKLGRVAA